MLRPPIQIFKNRLRNILIVTLRLFTSMYIIFGYILAIHYEFPIFLLSLLAIPFIFIIPKKLKVLIFDDVIEFKERAFHPNQNCNSGIAFENLQSYELRVSNSQSFFKLFTTIENHCIYKVFFIRKNGVQIIKRLSLTKTEKKEFIKILNSKLVEYRD